MALLIEGVIFDELTADPGSPVDGQVWYNTTENRLKVHNNGTTRLFIDKAEFELHSNSTANPHGTDLEAARTAGNTLTGDIDMGGNTITNLATPTADSDVATKIFVGDQIAQRLRSLDWQESVLDQDLLAPPGSPTTGDRYLVGTPASGAWTGLEDQIVEWDGSAWVASVPDEGFCTRVEDENLMIIYDGAAWGSFGGAVDHGNLLGLGDDDHTIYLLIDGSRAMTGNLDMGSNNIVTVGTVDGVTVSAHAARHIDGGADVIDADKLEVSWTPTNYTRTVAPAEVDALDQLTAHLAGIDTQLASTGAHAATHIKGGGDEVDGDQLDIDFTPVNYTPSTSPPEVSDVDHLSSHLAGIDTALAGAGGGLQEKSGKVLAASFSGSPQTASVAFSTAFSDAEYAVVLTPVNTSNNAHSPFVQSQIAGSFTINLGANNLGNLVQVNWIAMKIGES